MASKFKSHNIWPPFDQKILWNWQCIELANFRILFCQKGVIRYAIWILRPDLESSHHFTYFKPLIIIFTFVFFDLPWHFQNFENGTCCQHFFEINFLGQIRNQRPKRHNNGRCGDRFPEKKKMVVEDSQPGLMTYWTFLGGGSITCPPQ